MKLKYKLRILEIAREYGYDSSEWDGMYGISEVFIQVITSKEFINSFCNYLWKNADKNDYIKNYVSREFEDTINNFIYNQARAIYDDELELFYRKII